VIFDAQTSEALREVKRSPGKSREGGVHSLEFHTELRNVCVKL
jgi:hypothetical protein